MHIIKMTMATAFFIAASFRTLSALVFHRSDLGTLSLPVVNGAGMMFAEGVVSLVLGAVITLWLEHRRIQQLERAKVDKL